MVVYPLLEESAVVEVGEVTELEVEYRAVGAVEATITCHIHGTVDQDSVFRVTRAATARARGQSRALARRVGGGVIHRPHRADRRRCTLHCRCRSASSPRARGRMFQVGWAFGTRWPNSGTRGSRRLRRPADYLTNSTYQLSMSPLMDMRSFSNWLQILRCDGVTVLLAIDPRQMLS